jgi:hypothetical protein
MEVREVRLNDKIEIDKIYHAYWNHNEYPDFFNRRVFPCSFVVTDENEIILAGGIKIIAEAIVITDRGFSTRDRQEALLQAMGSSVLVAKDLGFKQIHAFVNNDEYYVKHLQKFGFKLINAKLLILDVGESDG